MKDHYSNVKIPKDCRLGKCDTCRQLAAENLTCKTPEERAALDIKKRNHDKLHSGERTCYKQDRFRAIAEPTAFM